MFCFLFSKETQRGVNPLKKAFMRDLKLIYRAANKDIAERALDGLATIFSTQS